MNKTFVVLMILFVTLVANAQTVNKTTNDVKIRQSISAGGGNRMETVLYIKGQRMRNESAGNVGFTTILQCDLKRTLTINEKTKMYLIMPIDGMNPTAGAADGGSASSAPAPQNQPQRGGIVNVTNTITDTGERKEMFGFTARRIKTSLEKKASPDACDKDQKVETDGWYIDFQYSFDCPGQQQKYQPTPVRPQPGCKDEIRTKTIGSAKLGFPLLVTTTVYHPDGRTTSMTQEVLELSREPLTAALFDIPEGYTLAKDMQQLYGMDTTSMSTPSSTNTAATTPASSAKKPGVIRIGLLRPNVQMSAGNAAQAAEALRNTFVSYLKSPNIEVVTLSAIEEARQSQCDYVLSASMNVKKGGGGSMFGRRIADIAGAAAGRIPSAGAGSAASEGIKARDEVTLEYKLDQVETAKTTLASKDKAKASTDGEDVIAPLVQKAAVNVIAVTQKQ
jgi:hypothetical protein